MSSLTPFEFHTNMHFEEFVSSSGEKQWKGYCPFCFKENHFFFGADWGWTCKSCQLKGNIYTFLKHVYEDICTHDLINVLAMERGISYETMSRNGVKYNPKNNSFVIPTYNSNSKLNYLYKVVQVMKKGEPKRQILNIPSLDPTLFSWPVTTNKTIWLCEGLWDKMAAEDIIGPARSITAVGFPGSVFKPTWCSAFADKELEVFTDNDKAGSEHIKTILNRLNHAPQKPIKTRTFRWPDPSPQGMDVNDVLLVHNSQAFEFLTAHLVEQEVVIVTATKSEIVPDTTCTSFEDLSLSCSEFYHFTPHMRMFLHLLITCLYSLKIEGEQLWVRAMGPPGSFKSTGAKMIGSSDQALLRSTFTGLLSGWKDDDPTDASLINDIAGKALIVMDGDALLQEPKIAKILSELRAFYDKYISVSYLNRVSYEYDNKRSSFIFIGTHTLRSMDNTALGERFLDFEIIVSQADRLAISSKSFETAILEAETGVSVSPALAAKAKNFIDNIILNREGVAKLHPDDRQTISTFGNVISYLRAKVERNRAGEIAYKPLAEVPSRIIKQMVMLYQCAPIILDKSEPNDEVINLAKKITLDIIDTSSHRYKVAQFLAACPKQSMYQIVEATQLEPKIVEREMDNMLALEMINIDKVWRGPGTSIRVISLRDDIQSQMQEINTQ